MNEHQRAGLKADATKVRRALEDRFTSPAKAAIRLWVARELMRVEPSLVLDLWGGGQSARDLTALGLKVLSVDDGRAGKRPHHDPPISNDRIRRALASDADEHGYQWGWGKAADYASQCDAAWLDFMGHLSADVVRTLEACRHMKMVIVTLMPERMAGVERLPIETWAAMYRAAVAHHTGLGVKAYKAVRRYRRVRGQWVLVLMFRPKSPGRLRTLTDEERLASKRADRHARMADPEYAEKKRAQHRAVVQALMADPEYRAKYNAQQRQHHRNIMAAADPEYRAALAAKRSARRRERLANEPEYRAKWDMYYERRRERMTDPEYRAEYYAKRNARRREREQERHATNSGTGYGLL